MLTKALLFSEPRSSLKGGEAGREGASLCKYQPVTLLRRAVTTTVTVLALGA